MINKLKSLFDRDFFWCCLVAVGVACLFLPAYSGVLGIFHDDIGMASFSRLFFLARSFQHGTIPLWDPHTWCGAIPFYARYFAETYYFPIWPFYAVADLGNYESAFKTLLVVPLYLHFCVAGWGMFMFVRRIVLLGKFAAFCAAFLFVMSPVFAYAHSWEQVIYHHCWVPWLMFVFCRLTQRWTWRLVASGGVLFALILLSANPSNWHFVFFLFGGTVAVKTFFVSADADTDVRKRALAGCALIVLLGVGISAVYLFSFAEGKFYMQEHIELTAQAAMAEKFSSLPVSYLASLFVPDIFGNITGMGLAQRTVSNEVVLFWESNLLGGIIVSFFVFLGMFSAWCMPGSAKGMQNNKRLWLRASVVLFVFGVLCSLGKNTFFYELIIGHIPGISAMPRPIRYRFLQCFGGAVLIGAGVDLILGVANNWCGAAKLKKLTFAYIAVVFVVVLGTLAWPLTHVYKTKLEWNRPLEADESFGPAYTHLPSGTIAGNVSPPNKSVEIKFFTNVQCSGQIRYRLEQAGTPQDGELIARYSSDKAGCISVDVDLPAGVFVWLVPDGGQSQLEVRAHKNKPAEGWIFDSAKWEWISIPDAQILIFKQSVTVERMSFFEKLQQPVWGKGIFVLAVVVLGGVLSFVFLLRMLFPETAVFSRWMVRGAVGCFAVVCLVLFGYFFASNTLFDLFRSHQSLPPMFEKLNCKINSVPVSQEFEWSDASIFSDGGGMDVPDSMSVRGGSVSNFSPPKKVHKLAVWFDRPCSGEIRTAKKLDDDGVKQGKRVCIFETDSAGWNFFDVDIEPRRFVAVLPDSKDVRVGIRPFPHNGFVRFPGQKEWQELPGASMLYFGQKDNKPKPLPKSYGSGQVLLKLILYFCAAATLICFIFLGNTGVGRFMCFVLLAEGFVWAFVAFYASSFSLGQLYPSQLRSLGASHSLFNTVRMCCDQTSKNPMYRTATTMPFYDNFFRVTGANAFMGYEMHPMESRFKIALEKALAMPLDYKIYYQLVRFPKEFIPFYDNFSVKYLLDSSSVPVFDGGTSVELKGQDDLFVNTNPTAVKRLRFVGKITSADETAQLNALVGKNLTDEVLFLPADYKQLSAGLKADPVFGQLTDVDFSNPNKVSAQVNLPASGVLVLTDVWFPGWRVFVDGKPARLYRVNYCQKAVVVEAGKHVVEFVFRPRIWTLGAIVSILFLCVTGILFFIRHGDHK